MLREARWTLRDAQGRFVRRIGTELGTSQELEVSTWNGPHWWLVIALAVLLPAATAFALLQAAPMVAPFVYTLF